VRENQYLIISALALNKSPTPATKEDSSSVLMGSFLFAPSESFLYIDFARNKDFILGVRYLLFLVWTVIPSVHSVSIFKFNHYPESD